MQKEKLLQLSTYFTVGGVFIIILAKIFGWYYSQSVTMLATLVDSLLDICVSIINLLALRYALQPADHVHRFGHGKAEDIAVFSQAVFFIMSGLFLISASIDRIYHPNTNILAEGAFAMEILLFSTFITFLIVLFQHYVMRKAKSNVIEADSIHYLTDFLTNFASIFGIYITTHFDILVFDSIAAIGIAFYIIINAIKLFRKALNNLMDHELHQDERNIIIEVIKSHAEVRGFHDLKTRYSGVKSFIQFHLELDGNMSLKQAHRIVSEIEERILKKIPNAEFIIHQDPEGADEDVSYID